MNYFPKSKLKNFQNIESVKNLNNCDRKHALNPIKNWKL